MKAVSDVFEGGLGGLEEEARRRADPCRPALAMRLAARPTAGQFAFGLLAVLLALMGAGCCGGPGRTRAKHAFVTNQLGNSLSVVDLATASGHQKSTIGGKPAGIALSADGRTSTSPLRTAARSRRRRYRGANGAARARSSAAVRSASPSIRKVRHSIVADWYEHRLYVVDPGTLCRHSHRSPVDCPRPGVAVTADGKTLLSADRDSNQVSAHRCRHLYGHRHHPDGRATVRRHDRWRRPRGAYTANVASNSMTVVDLKTRTRLKDVPVGLRPYAVARAGGGFSSPISTASSVSVIDAVTLAGRSRRFRVGSFPEGIEADPTGTVRLRRLLGRQHP